MTRIRRIVAIVLAIGVVPGVLGGCDVTFTGDSSSDQSCDNRTLDLRTQPTRGDVGLETGESSASWSCEDGFRTTILLPQGQEIELESRRVSFSTYGAAADTARPQAVDVHSPFMSIDEAADLATTLAEELGMPRGEIDQWRRQAENPPDDTVDTKTSFIKGSTTGQPVTSMQIIHQSVSGNNNVHLIFYYGR